MAQRVCDPKTPSIEPQEKPIRSSVIWASRMLTGFAETIAFVAMLFVGAARTLSCVLIKEACADDAFVADEFEADFGGREKISRS